MRNDKHHQFMMEAIDLARKNVGSGEGGPFGAVVVRDDKIVGIGRNMVISSNDPTAHAEVVAIRDTCQKLNTFELKDCVIYSSCEPCPMCLSAIYWARISKIYYAASRFDAADAGFDDAFLYEQITLDESRRSLPSHPMMREEAVHVFREWAQYENKKLY